MLEAFWLPFALLFWAFLLQWAFFVGYSFFGSLLVGLLLGFSQELILFPFDPFFLSTGVFVSLQLPFFGPRPLQATPTHTRARTHAAEEALHHRPHRHRVGGPAAAGGLLRPRSPTPEARGDRHQEPHPGRVPSSSEAPTGGFLVPPKDSGVSESV